MLNTQRSFTSK